MAVDTHLDFAKRPGRQDRVADGGRDRLAQAIGMRALPVADWDAVMAGFDDACQEQLYVFARNRWPGVTCEPWLFVEGEQTVGGVMMMVQPLPLRMGSLAICKWGPLLKDRSHGDPERVYAGMIEALIAEYAHKRKMMLSILPRAATAATNTQLAHLERRGFRLGAQLPYPNRYFVRLGLNDDAQLKSFGQKWRYHLRKSESAGLSFREAGAEAAPVFDALYQAMSERKRFPDHSAYDDTITALMAIKDENVRPRLFMVDDDGGPIAGAIIFTAGQTAVYLYGATNERALPARAGYFMHWHIIRWLRDHSQANWYDLGGTDGFQGLHQFKKGMVGDVGVISQVPPVANYASALRPMIMGNAAFAARDGVNLLRRKIETLRNPAARPDQER